MPALDPAWQRSADGRALERTVRFADFRRAFAFMTHVALLAEKQDHHPDWSNSYGVVRISLSSHDAGGITERDERLAAGIDAILTES